MTVHIPALYFSLLPLLPFPHLRSRPLRSRNPLIAARGSGGVLKLPQQVAAKRILVLLGIILHLFECLNDEEFPVVCS